MVIHEMIGNENHGDIEEGGTLCLCLRKALEHCPPIVTGTFIQEMNGLPDNLPEPITSIEVPLDAWGRPYCIIGRVIGNSNNAPIPSQGVWVTVFNDAFA